MLCHLCAPGGFYSLLLCKQGGPPFQRSALSGFDPFNFGPPGGFFSVHSISLDLSLFQVGQIDHVVIEDAGSGKQDADNDCKFDYLVHEWRPPRRDKGTPAAPVRRMQYRTGAGDAARAGAAVDLPLRGRQLLDLSCSPHQSRSTSHAVSVTPHQSRFEDRRLC